MKNNLAGQNPYLPLWEHLPDGSPRVFEDPDNPGKFRIYIIGSHDLRMDSYCGADIRMWSAPAEDLTAWRDHGPIFTYQDPNTGLWDVMYAPDMAEVTHRDGTKWYYLYPHSRGPGREPMVARSKRPDGPFETVNVDENGRVFPGSVLGFDPAICVEQITDPSDPDYEIGFRAYAYWGFRQAFAGQLDQNNMYALRPGTEAVKYFIPSSERYGELRDPEGTQYPHVFQDEDLIGFNYFEAFDITKVGNKYVLVFSGYSGPDYGLGSTNSSLRYAYGDTPLGPWRSGGVLVDSRAVVPSADGQTLIASGTAHNTHGGLANIGDMWYVFYHRAARGFGYARQAMVDPMHVEWDEKPVSEGGQVRICAFDPFADGKKWTAKAANGNEYKGAQVTSEGLNIFGLPPYNYYSAGIASYFSHPYTLQNAWDIWENHQPITNVAGGHIIGFKHFGFGGLNAPSAGLPAFAGTAPGNNSEINLWLTPLTAQEFAINIFLGEPSHGKKIGRVTIPANSPSETTKVCTNVNEAIDNLDQKHAIFLVVEGSEAPLFDLIGLGFSSDKIKTERPVAPTVTISANGQPITLPQHPTRSTHANGIVDYSIYEISAPANAKITATASCPSVKIEIANEYVKFDYNGAVKTYRIV
ncbi:MAG: hypothetical protein FWC78_07925 [Defluviitaleaceae bacterium]|nr:hypothetical protein [Defluviitaleaceae bacterium]